MTDLLSTPDLASAPDGTIAIENPATGEQITVVDNMGAERVQELVTRARRAQPGVGGARVRRAGAPDVRACATGSWPTAPPSSTCSSPRTARRREDALLAELFYMADSLGFWAKRAEKYLADEKVRTHSPFVFGKKVVVRLPAARRRRRDRAVELPAHRSASATRIPALMAGNTVVMKPSEVTPLATLHARRGRARGRLPAGRVPASRPATARPAPRSSTAPT